MKRFALYIGIVATLVASCSVQEEDFKTPVQDDIVFYASFEQPAEETKVYANENLLLRWNADDRVSIFNKNTYNQEYRFTGETGDNAGGFRKVDLGEFVTGNAMAKVVSVYPYQEGSTITEDEILTLTLPAEQHYAENTFGLGANTMVSVSSDNFLQYKNVGGFLRLRLYGKGVSVSSITLKGNNGEKMSGKATVAMPLDGTPTVSMANDASDEITLLCDTPVELGATAEESTEFWFVVPPLTFSRGFAVTGTMASGEVFGKSTSKSIVIERSNLCKMSPLELEIIKPTVSVPEAVDLGLPSGLKWASFNVGATRPEEYGDYYAWGETEPKTVYSWETYKWCMGSSFTFTKYCQRTDYGYNGYTDVKPFLDLEDDAAHVNLGSKWRMPTDAEIEELMNNCTWEWTPNNGMGGFLVTGPNGNSIFLPAAGDYGYSGLLYAGTYGHYWSSSLTTDSSNLACHAAFWGDDLSRGGSQRCLGASVRPVFGPPAFINVPVESVRLNETHLNLCVGGNKATLYATVSPFNASNSTVFWSSSDVSIATVSSSGVVTGIAPGSAIISVTTVDGGKTATCSVTVTELSTYSPPLEAIDLGLPSGLKWASFNVGATRPEEYGDYYAWGETEPKTVYSWETYKWCMGSEYTLIKYCQRSDRGYNGITDTKTVLDLEDDAAYVNLGSKWRVPTDVEWVELQNNCTWEWTSIDGIFGRKVTGPNGNSIFLPTNGTPTGASANGTVRYWTSSLDTECPQFALYVYINSNYSNYFRISYEYRCYGRSIRPVTE